MKTSLTLVCLVLGFTGALLGASAEVEAAKVAFSQEKAAALAKANEVLAKSGAALVAGLPSKVTATERKTYSATIKDKLAGTLEGPPPEALAKLFAGYDKSLANATNPLRTKYLAKLQNIAAKQTGETAKETLAIAAQLENTGIFAAPPAADGSVSFEVGGLPQGWQRSPLGNSTLKLGTPAQGLTFTAAVGATLFAEKNLDGPRVLKSCKEDFECYATVSVPGKSVNSFAGAGLMVWIDSQYFWRLMVCSEPKGESLEFGRLKAGEWKVVKKKDCPKAATTVDLRMVRRGPILEASWRPTGSESWTHLNQSLLPDGVAIPALLVGPVVANETSNPVTAAFSGVKLLQTQTDPTAAAEAAELAVYRKKRDAERAGGGGTPSNDPEPAPAPSLPTGAPMVAEAGEVFRQDDQAILANLATSPKYPKTVDASGAPLRDTSTPQSRKYLIVLESLKAKAVTEITESSITTWGDATATTVGGKPAWRIPLQANASTIFGNVSVRIHAVVMDARIVGWYYSGSGEPVQ